MAAGQTEQPSMAPEKESQAVVLPLSQPRAEGGRQAWLTVLGSWLVYFPTFGFITSFGFFQTYYQAEMLQSSSPATISFIGSVQLALMYLMGPIAGALFDAYGIKYLYIGAGLGCSVSLLALSFSQPDKLWQQFLTQGVLFGISSSFGVQPALAAVGQYFVKRRALVMGIVAAGSSLGGFAFPFFFSGLIPRLGFAWTVRLAALICLVFYGVALLISRPAVPTRRLKAASELLDFSGFKDPRYLFLALGTFIGNLGLYVPYYYIQGFALSLGPLPNGLDSALLPLINGVSLFGRVLGGLAADKIGRLNVLWPMTVACGILCLTAWLLAQGIAAVVVFVCLYGFCSGVFISIIPAVVGQISPEDRLGARIGALFSLTAVATLTGSPIAGALLKDRGSRDGYMGLIAFAGATLLGGGILLTLARRLCSRDWKSKI